MKLGHSLIVPLNEIIKAVVRNQSSTLAKFYLRDMSQQAVNLYIFGQIVVAEKVVGARKIEHMSHRED